MAFPCFGARTFNPEQGERQTLFTEIQTAQPDIANNSMQILQMQYHMGLKTPIR